MEAYLPKLKEYFGFNQFRDGQSQIIQAILEEGRDVCGILATGQGKSLCYQFPAIYTGKTSIVVSPLISLMQDQKMALLAKKITCECLNGGTRNYLNTTSAVVRGEYSVVYTTPEFIQNNKGLLRKMEDLGTLGLIAIDEAHCISQWGHDFRPAFRKLTDLRDAVDNVPILTLTATATPTIIKDICHSMSMKNVKVVQTTIYRPNLSIWVRPKSSSASLPEIREILGSPSLYRKKLVELTQREAKRVENEGDGCLMDSDSEDEAAPTKSGKVQLKFKKREIKSEKLSVHIKPDEEEYPSAGNEDSVIIYTQSRKDAEKICTVLKRYNYPVEYYHAGLSPNRRQEVHENFIYDRTPIVCATIAFGMGIDKPSIRKIINWGMPGNLETYYQEIGRAGRDGLESSCYLFHDGRDLAIHKFLIGKMTAPKNVQDHHLHLLNIMRQWTTTEICRQYQIARYFSHEQLILDNPTDEERAKFCGVCDNCLSQELNGPTSTEKIDIAKEAKLLLRLIKSLSINYGFKNLTGVLIGSRAKTFPARLKNHILYSDGDYHSQAYWRALGDLMIDHGYLKYTKVGGMFGNQRKGKFGASKVFQVVAVGNKKLSLDDNMELWVMPNSGLRQHIKKTTKSSNQINITPNSAELLLKLKELRTTISREMNLPPYIIMSDPVINNLLRIKNGSHHTISVKDLTLVDGLNIKVVMTFGDQLVEIINST